MTTNKAIEMAIEALKHLTPPFDEGYMSECEHQGFKALAALRALPKDEWQEIATAPKDRKYILAWSPERRMAFQVIWRDGRYILIGDDSVHWDNLTHWQPLPGPPKEQE